jgi:tetratricopeptide (TPR) repeat protein
MSLTSKFCKIVLILGLTLGISGCFETSQERAEEHYQSGLSLVNKGDLPRAIIEFRNTLQLDDTNLEAYRQLAFANQASGRPREAYGYFLNLVERAPEDIEGRVSLSELAFRTGNWEEFKRHGDMAMKLDPERPEVRAIGLGLGYRKAFLGQKVAERAGIVAKAEALAKDLPDNSILRQIRLDTLIANGKYDSALILLNESIAETPQSMGLYTLRLELLSRLGKTGALEAELRNMLDVFPTERGPKETYLRYLMSRDRPDDAQNYLEDLVANAGPEERNAASVTLLQFIQQTKGADAALAKTDELLAHGKAGDGLLRTFRASLMFEMGQRHEGIAALEDILDSETLTLDRVDHERAKMALAQMLLASGNEVGARKQVEEVLEADVRAPDALMMRANWSISGDDTDAAIADLRTVLEDTPNNAMAMVLLAKTYERAGNRDLMLSFLSQAVEASSNAPRYALGYARALVGQEKFLQAESTLISTLRIAPGNFDVLSALGNVYLRMDDMPRASRVGDTIAALENPRAENAANLLKTEVLARRVGPDQALEFIESIAKQKGDVASKLALIQAQLQAGQTEAALAVIKKAVEELPDNLQLRAALAMTHAAMRDFALAASQIEIVLAKAPKATKLYLQLARINGAGGDLSAARAAIDRGLGQAPGAPDLLWAKASYLQEAGDIDGAITIYDALYERNSSNAIVANNLASLLSTYRDDADSLIRAEAIARRLGSSEVPAFQDTYGWILFRKGAAEEAISYLEPAAAGLPRDVRVQFHLAQAYDATERRAKALAQMRKALEVSGPIGDPGLRQEIEARIVELTITPTLE